MKKLFSTPKKAIISTLCITAAVFGAAVAVPAVILNNTLIGKNEAENTALKDAGLNVSQVSGLRSELDFEDGRFQYEVDFYCDGIEYEYRILAGNGDIAARDTDGKPIASASINDESTYQEATLKAAEAEQAAPNMQTRETADESANQSAENAVISLDEAKTAALADAGLSEDEVTFTKMQLDRDDRRQVYEIEFYSADAEHDYEINASDGTVRESSIDAYHVQDDTGAVNATPSDQYIGVDKAKEIAVNHAGFTESEVHFSKAKLENDDRTPEYEIEFYYGTDEYEYNIDASTGGIIEFSAEHN